MGKATGIQWCHHTFNPWWGCEKVSPACTRCYAEAFAKRVGESVWGKDAPRRFFGDAHWREPLRWNREAHKAGERRRVFCASMADVFEDRRDLHEPRERLWELIRSTLSLDWLLLTKRPENIWAMTPGEWHDNPPRNVWYGTTAENQEWADLRIEALVTMPVAVRFLSVEPILGPVDLSKHFKSALLKATGEYRDGGAVMRVVETDLIDWVIVGGESGPGARTTNLEWIRDVVRQCREHRVAVHVKQLGAKPTLNYYDDFREEFEYRTSMEWPDPIDWDCEHDGQPPLEARVILPLKDRKGGEMSEWPEDLRIREWPNVGAL